MIATPVFRRLARTSLSTRIVAGLLLGVFVGLFLGEPAAVLQPLADIYIRLMQMTVLPYMVLALVIGFGQLDASQAKRLGLRAGILLLLVWVVTGAVLATMTLVFPDTQSASFFSHSLVEPKSSFSVAELYFTDNPFHSLANAIIPAVVLFSSLVGIFLIGLEGREQVLDLLKTLNASIERMTRFMIGLTPIGVFAIGAATAGTMSLETFERVEAYFLVFTTSALLLVFWIFPVAITSVTPFSYREVLSASKDALLTAFVTNNVFLVLPILVTRARVLLRRHGLLTEESNSAAEILVPVFFNFPNAGRLLTLLFVPFAAWMTDSIFSMSDLALLFAVGIPTYFAKAQVALPFLLDFFGLPHDLFQLYVPSALVNGKFDSMVAAMNLFVFALIGSAAMGGFLTLRRRRLVTALASTLAGLAITAVAVRLLLGAVVDTTYSQGEALQKMHASREIGPVIVHRDASTVARGTVTGPTTMEELSSRGTLRIGYDPANYPFSFFNADEQLVGLDVELGYELASSLGLQPEYVPIEWATVPQMLASDLVDVVPSLWYRPFWFSSVRLSMPYLSGTMGLIVRDEHRHAFANVDELRRMPDLEVGVPLDVTQVQYSMRRYFGDNDVRFVPSPSARAFFEGAQRKLAAFLMPAEGGAAWTLLHPEYTVVVPQPNPVKIPFAFGLALDSEDLLALVDEWVLFAENEGLLRDAYEYWVLGKGARDETPRWSILRDVLGWVD